jgi:hypothetical protein
LQLDVHQMFVECGGPYGCYTETKIGVTFLQFGMRYLLVTLDLCYHKLLTENFNVRKFLLHQHNKFFYTFEISHIEAIDVKSITELLSALL